MRILMLVVLVSSLGCASASLEITQPLPHPVREVSVVFEPADEVTMTGEQQSRFRSTLTTSLVDSGIAVRSSGSSTAAMEGEVERYEPGNRALRYLIGFGAGSGKFASTWLVRGPSGGEIGACRVDGSISMGVFGGSYDDVLEKVGERLSEFLLKKR